MKDKILAMRMGGKALAWVKRGLQSSVHVGTSFEEIEEQAQQLIHQSGMRPSFSTVPGYSWATCIMKNDALCHGIPVGKIAEDGDIISIDVGLINHGFHLDTTLSFGVGNLDQKKRHLLTIGQETLLKAISKAKRGASVYDISKTIEDNLLQHNLGAVYQLTGHGVGEELHQDPSIPCVADPQDKRVKLHDGQTIAIEVMCTVGKPELVLDEDGWTYRTKDGSLSAMFEETVLITGKGPEILTN